MQFGVWIAIGYVFNVLFERDLKPVVMPVAVHTWSIHAVRPEYVADHTVASAEFFIDVRLMVSCLGN